MTENNASIFTFCNNNGPVNYGQILQCYAIQQILEEFGYRSQIVLYQKSAIKELFTKRVRKFREFVGNNINTTGMCFSDKEVETVIGDCSLLVCGSDQVWFPDTVDKVWTLGVGNQNARRISFAASGLFYDDKYTNEKLGRVGKYIDQLDFISVREISAIGILRKYTKKKIEIFPDPTLFLDADTWDKIASKEKYEEKYIFCYCLGGIRPYGLIFKKLMNLYGVTTIKYIPSNLIDEGEYANMESIDDAGPSEFLNLIKHAQAVITDSYHGVIFSIIYGTDWYNLERLSDGIDRFGGKIRVEGLADHIASEWGWVRNVKDVIKRYGMFKHSVDYSQIERRVECARKRLDHII